ncbi:MAG: 50S ribosomal protein L29 [Acidobacteriota bacterium]|nr:50S ribosomal protein L29 [Acidobacteriota bacterium]
MKADKIRELDNTELGRQEQDARAQMFRLRFQLSMGQTDGMKKLRVLRKDRARMLTILRDRELHPDSAPEPESKKKKSKPEPKAVARKAKPAPKKAAKPAKAAAKPSKPAAAAKSAKAKAASKKKGK